MGVIENRALKEFGRQIGSELVMAQVLIRRDGGGYELRHVEDRNTPEKSLRLVSMDQLRKETQYTESGAFRPLKSAPTLQKGWRVSVSGDAELDAALSRLYPGAVADWHAARGANPPVTNYREFTNRQSGMYRITTKLSDTEVAQVIGDVCAREHCMKRRLWSVGALGPDAPGGKSIIPCLEPCMILLEATRRAVRAEQQKANPKLADEAGAH